MKSNSFIHKFIQNQTRYNPSRLRAESTPLVATLRVSKTENIPSFSTFVLIWWLLGFAVLLSTNFFVCRLNNGPNYGSVSGWKKTHEANHWGNGIHRHLQLEFESRCHRERPKADHNRLPSLLQNCIGIGTVQRIPKVGTMQFGGTSKMNSWPAIWDIAWFFATFPRLRTTPHTICQLKTMPFVDFSLGSVVQCSPSYLDTAKGTHLSTNFLQQWI